MTVCGSPIGGGVASFLCRLEAGHLGPHSSPDIMRTVEARKRWMKEEEASASPDVSVAAPDALLPTPLTFAQHYMAAGDQPPPHPSDRDALEVEDEAPPDPPPRLPEQVQEHERSGHPQAIAEAVTIVSTIMDGLDKLVVVLKSMLPDGVEQNEMRD